MIRINAIYSVFAVLALLTTSACAEKSLNDGSDDFGFIESELARSQLSLGASRDDIIEKLGQYYRSLTPTGFAPVCDTYRYIEDGKEMYLHIWYRGNSGVSEFSFDHSTTCGII